MRRSPAEVWQPQLTGPATVHPHGIFFQAAVAKPPQPQPFHRALLSPDNLSSRTRAEPPTPQHTMCECRRTPGGMGEPTGAAAGLTFTTKGAWAAAWPTKAKDNRAAAIATLR